MSKDRSICVAILLSCDSFESFFGRVLSLDRDRYLKDYRNDFSWYYSRGLIDNGIRPILYIPSVEYEGLYETDLGIDVRFLRFPTWYRPLAPLRRPMRATRWSLYAQECLNAAALLSPLQKALTSDQVDLLYMQEYWGGRFDYLVSRVSVPLAAADHGGVSKGVVKWFKRQTFQKAAMIYCQTEDECLQVMRYGIKPVLQPNGIDTSLFFPPLVGSTREKIILTVARLTDKQKRTSDLIRAMKLLSNDWHLHVIGIGPDRAFLDSLALSSGVASRVTFHGFVGQTAIRSFCQKCGVFAMPSANEGLPLAVLEAMSCGAAVVASRIRAFESFIIDGVNGKLFPMGNVSALAYAIQVAWDDHVALGSAASLSASDRFDAKILYGRLAQSIRNIVN